MNHEFPDYHLISVDKDGYKIDGKGIKYFLKANLKSVDYYYHDDDDGFTFVEFSDLFRQDTYIKDKIERLGNSSLIPKDKKDLRKYYYKLMNKELVEKYKDSVLIKTSMKELIINIPSYFDNNGFYCVVVPPIGHLEKHKQIEIAKFLTNLKNKLTLSLPVGLSNGVKVIPLNYFCSMG